MTFSDLEPLFTISRMPHSPILPSRLIPIPFHSYTIQSHPIPSHPILSHAIPSSPSLHLSPPHTPKSASPTASPTSYFTSPAASHFPTLQTLPFPYCFRKPALTHIQTPQITIHKHTDFHRHPISTATESSNRVRERVEDTHE